MLTEQSALAKLIVGFSNKQINVIEKADAIKFLYEKYGDVETVSKKVSLDTSLINRYIRVAKLPEVIKQSALEGKLTSYHVLSEISRIKPESKMIEVALKIGGIPRETAREIIRYIFRNPDRDVDEAIQYVIQSYGEKFKLNLFIISKSDVSSTYDLNSIQLDYFSDRIHITDHGDYLIAIIKKNDVYKIRTDGYDLMKFVWSVANN